MNSFLADLHCHSTCSDGSSSPIEILELAKEIGISALSITDHDTISAYQTAIPAAKELGITLLTGVEFSSMQSGTSIHILGYGFSPDSPEILALCQFHSERRAERNRQILNLLSQNGMPITEEEVAAFSGVGLSLKTSVGRPHIALAMIKKGYVANLRDAFKHFLAEGKPCFSQGALCSVEETIDVIHQSKGLAVIAHPHLIKNNQVLREVLQTPIDGIECYYGNFPPQHHKRWLKLAKKHDWLITGGSDFHGSIKPHNPLGASCINKELFEAITNRLPST